MSELFGYGRLHSFGGSGASQILKYPVRVEEKVDGSQFSFAKQHDGRLAFRSKSVAVDADDPHMFAAAINAIREVEVLLPSGVIFRGEYLAKPKHNHLAYDRVPRRHVILFDAHYLNQAGEFAELDREVLEGWASELSMEVVPELHRGTLTREQIDPMMQTRSVLGGQIVEGIVIKSLVLTDPLTGQPLRAKSVRASFKEDQRKEWRENRPTRGDIIEMLVERHRTKPRWRKAIQHLAEEGKLTNSPRDIPELIREVQRDIADECRNDIHDALFQWAWRMLSREVVRGLPEFYKAVLAGDD